MVEGLSFNNLAVDEKGRVTVSGISSGIDLKGTVNAIIAAKRIPIDQLDARVVSNQNKITEFTNLRTAAVKLRNALSTLYGAVSVGGTSDVFKAKSTFATVSRADGTAPSAAGNLIGVSASNAALLGSHDIEIKQIAKAHKIASQSFASTSAALSLSGTFDIGSTTITVQSSDSLGDVRDRINNANTGANATGVSASIVTVSSSEHYLVLTKDATGTSMSVTDSGTVLSGLGLSSNNGATYTNVLQAAKTAQFYADGILDSSNKLYESAVQTSPSTQLGSSGTIRFDDGTTYDFAYTATDTLQDLADNINADASLQAKNISASIVQEGSGYRLKITGTGSAFTMTETGAGSLLSDYGITNERKLLERANNTVTDVFAGVTLSLFQAEPGTTIKIDVEADLATMKQAITNFVDAYNELRVFINTENLTTDTTGQVSSESGVLFGNTTMNDLRQRLANVAGIGTRGVSADFSVLAQIGISFATTSDVTDALEVNTLLIDESKLDEALINNLQDIRRLFVFEFTSSDPNVVYLSSTGQTTYSSTGYTLNIGTIGQLDQDSAIITDKDATLDQADSFAATTSGQFSLNGTLITYDVTADTLVTLASKINDAAISGVSASVIETPSGARLTVVSTSTPLTYTGDTGDLVAALTMAGDPDQIDSADIDGASGSVTTSGRVLTVTDQTGAEGLKLIYTGAASVSGIQIDFTLGVGAQMFNILETILDETEGSLQGEIASMEGQNLLSQKRIEEMENRLSVLEATLLAKFTAMETALATLDSLSASIKQITDAWFNTP